MEYKQTGSKLEPDGKHVTFTDGGGIGRLAKSISDAAWGRLLWWLTYYGVIHAIPVVAVEPAYTSQDCSACGTRVKKSLLVRTHICTSCGIVLDRDHNAARNILAKASKRTGGQSGTRKEPSL